MKTTILRKAISLSAIAILGALALSGCSALGAKSSTAAETTLTPVAVGATINAGRVVPESSLWVAFQTGGRVAEVMVAEGQTVQAGDTLATLADPQAIQAEIAAAQFELTSAQQALADLNSQAEVERAAAWQSAADAQLALVAAQRTLDAEDTDARKNQLDDDWARVQEAQDELKDAQENFDKYAGLDEDNSTRKNAQDRLDSAQNAYDAALRDHDELAAQLEQARAAAAQAEAAAIQAQQAYEDRKSGPDPDALVLAEQRVDSAQAQLTAAQLKLDQYTLKAPADGVVTSLNTVAGESVTAGQAMVQLAQLQPWFVETTDLDELKVGQYTPGTNVTVTIDALPVVTLTGIVDRVSLTSVEKSGDVTYTARIRLAETPDGLRWGMTAEVRID